MLPKYHEQSQGSLNSSEAVLAFPSFPQSPGFPVKTGDQAVTERFRSIFYERRVKLCNQLVKRKPLSQRLFGDPWRGLCN
jgi:hypothetical protein